MQKNRATGLDTLMMIPIYAGIFSIICQGFLPWISIPALRYSRMPQAYTVLKMNDCLNNFQASLEMNGKIPMAPLSNLEISEIAQWIPIHQIVAAITMILLIVCIATIYVSHEKAKPLAYFVYSIHLIFCILQVAGLFFANTLLNDRIGRANSFINLTVHSYMQPTAWAYCQIFLDVALLFFMGRLLTVREMEPMKYIERTAKDDRRFGKRTAVSIVLILVAIPLMIFFGIFFLNDRSAVFIGLCIVLLSMLPFAMVFEDRKPQARELLLIAVLSGIAVAGRAAFFFVPQFKPVTAIVIIAGIGLGAEAGFLTGAISGFVSNFFFGQGPWTPWQMFAFGIIGFLAGIIFHRNKYLANAPERVRRFCECLFGGLATLLIYGIIMDFSTIMTFSSGFTWELFAARLLSGIPFNIIHAVSTVFFLLIMARPMERKLDRIKKKYGILEV